MRAISADSLNSVVTFKEVFDEELLQIQRGRRARQAHGCADCDHTRDSLIGLALSGGGIRSATFNLGVLQSLAKHRLLHRIDYVSSVSGGGYIAGWLKALTRRYLDEVPNSTFADVEDALRPEPYSPEHRRERPFLHWLRLYSSYLTPNRGVVSGDSWSMISTWRRNATLNQLVLLFATSAVFVFIFFLIHSLEYLQGLPATQQGQGYGYPTLAILCLAAGVLTVATMGRNIIKGDDTETRNTSGSMHAVDWITMLAPICVAVFLNAFLELPYTQSRAQWWVFVAGGTAFYAVPGIAAFLKLPPGNALVFEFANGVAGAIGGLTVWAYMQLLPSLYKEPGGKWLSAVLGPAILVEILVNAGILRQGLTGSLVDEFRRERWARVGGYVTLTTLAWLLLASCTIFGPLLVRWCIAMAPRMSVSGVLLWIVTTWGGLIAAKGEAAGVNPAKEILEPNLTQKVQAKVVGFLKTSRGLEITAKVAPYVFAVGSLLLLATTVNVIFGTFVDKPKTLQLWWNSVGQPHQDLSVYWTILREGNPTFMILAFLILGGAACLISSRVDINDFSLHDFYRNRLVRAYLGASVSDRVSDPFTRLSPRDDLPLSSFTNHEKVYPGQRDEKYCDPGPYPIFNAALNISSGSELGYSTRRAKSFFFTPLYCGYEETAPDWDANRRFSESAEQRETSKRYWFESPIKHELAYCRTFAKTESGRVLENGTGCSSAPGVSLGTAMSVSGAAASPNMGFHTSMATRLLMTLFDVRLGLWLGNTRYINRWKTVGPRFGFGYLFSELFGHTDQNSDYIYLSDGGHFENLGVYELLRRHCKLIIACDASCDGKYEFEGLLALIEKARTDFGATIVINLDELCPSVNRKSLLRTSAVGTIYYDPDPKHANNKGTLIYLKAGMPGDRHAHDGKFGLPPDVWKYHTENPSFPHQDLADQWFDETQFESYRALGEYVGDMAADTIGKEISHLTLWTVRDFFHSFA